MRLIDADNLYCEVKKIIGNKASAKAWAMANAIRTAPTIKAEPVKHGKWLIDEGRVLQSNIDGTFSIGNTYICSECNWKCSCEEKLDFSYCPNCGAKMEVGNECEQA